MIARLSTQARLKGFRYMVLSSRSPPVTWAIFLQGFDQDNPASNAKTDGQASLWTSECGEVLACRGHTSSRGRADISSLSRLKPSNIGVTHLSSPATMWVSRLRK